MTRPQRQWWAMTGGILLAATVVVGACGDGSTRPSPSTAAPGTSASPLATATAAQPSPSTAAPGTSASPLATATAAPEDDDDGVFETPIGAVPAALETAAAFVAAWARPGLDQAAWYAGVAPLAVPAYAAKLSTVDPARVPATAVTGAPTLVSAVIGAAIIDVPTDVGPIRLACIETDGRWLVADVAETRSR